jgi:molybdopterin-biosynthesis enzyme MoeA-like protein
VVVPDRVAEIARFVRQMSAEFELVLTSGGIGPTHDDVTLEGIAAAFEVDLVEHPQLVGLLHSWRGAVLDPPTLRLARVPAGATLLWVDGSFPLVQMRNVYILPGVPRLLRRKFEALVPHIEGEPLHQRQFTTAETELTLAERLRAVQQAYPEVSIGSYPISDRAGTWQVRLVLKARDPEALDRACALLLQDIPELTERTEPSPEDPAKRGDDPAASRDSFHDPE